MQSEDPQWTDYRSRFSTVYDQANYGDSLQARVMRMGHKLAEKPFGPNTHFNSVLEVGAGTGEHAPFVRHSFDRYVITDADPEALTVAKKKLSGFNDGKLQFEVQSANALNFPDGSFDRLIATHVLEHLYEPHKVLKEWRRVLRPGGTMTILIPTDPGLAWRMSRHFGPRRNATRMGFSYDYVMAREHVNPCNNLVALLRHYFPAALENWWPFGLPSMDINLFHVCQAVMHGKSEQRS
ncbi:class I SAM-dependent methyltransferase [Aestuariivirga sp.]|uniref:class I SAM-dependent methyltransferase n=1 Tax=Aestuariivirga sp. TaxID=2650926 RepID=UPI003BA85C59